MFMKKWWLQFTTDDGREWSGWINTTSDHRESFPEDFKGDFYTFKGEGPLGFGCYGCYKYDSQTWEEARSNKQYVITNKMIRPIRLGRTPINHKEAEIVFESLSRSLPAWERFEKRIEDCLNKELTYISEY